MSLIRKHGAVLQAWACFNIQPRPAFKMPKCSAAFLVDAQPRLKPLVSTNLSERRYLLARAAYIQINTGIKVWRSVTADDAFVRTVAPLPGVDSLPGSQPRLRQTVVL